MLRTVKESKGPCPVCGAPEHSCEGLSGTGIVFEAELKSRFTAQCDVVEDLPGRSGAQVLKYRAGSPIPLLDAMKQGLVSINDLSEDERNAIRVHVIRGQASVAEVKAWLKPPHDKQIKDSAMVRK